MSAYTLGFVFDSSQEKVLLVHKQRPAWQAGKVNGIGGKVELGETPHTGIVRECQEETALYIPESAWKHFGVIQENGATIELFTTVYDGPLEAATQTDHEEISWLSCNELPRNVIANLHYLVPMAREILRGHQVKAITIRY